MARDSLLLPSIRGLSLIELLVAIAIGVTLSLGAMNVLLHSKLGYLRADELARLHENGRYAMRYLTRELTMAGYLATQLPRRAIGASVAGTACFDHLLNTTSALDHINDVSATGLADSREHDLPIDCRSPGRHVPGSDVLLVRRTVAAPVVAAGRYHGTPDSDAIYLLEGRPYDPPRLQRGISGVGPGSLWEYVPQVLFLRNYSRAIGDDVPALCRKRLSRSSNRMAPTECLVEGIENVQLEFGIDEDGDMQADRFEQSPDVGDMGAAVAARIYLLVRSVRPIAGYRDDRFYQLGNTRVPPAHDSHYRRVMQTTVLLRNNRSFLS